MLLTKKLLTFLNRVFDKDPIRFLALRLTYDGGMSWRVEDAVLHTSVSGGIGHDLTVDLSQHTVASLVGHLASQPGYSVLYIDGGDLAQLSARVLIDGGADIATSNGDHIYGYSNVLWSYLEAAANELMQAKAAIAEMLKQLSTLTAGDIWLDELGGHYGVPRLAGELDQQYGPRIIAEVLRPRENNVAMEAAIKTFTGQSAKVTDVVEWTPVAPTYNGAITHNSSNTYSSSASPLYGLFDVQYGYDLLNGGDYTSFQATVRDLIDRLRAAGTHLRAMALVGSALSDEFSSPTDEGAAQALTATLAIADTRSAPSEATTIAVSLGTMTDSGAIDAAADSDSANFTFTHTYSGLRTYNGDIYHRGGYTFNGATLENDLAGSQSMP